MMAIQTESQIAVRMRGTRIALAILSAALLMGTLMTRRAGAQVFATLHSFNRSDGSDPQAGLIRDSMGNLYGTTAAGGPSGDGTVFKLDPSGNLTVLHSFSGNDGVSPYAGLILDSMGNLYGTTAEGGSGYGTAFKLDPSGTLTVLHSFSNTDGALPFAGLARDASGDLYGTTAFGGSSGYGTVFKLEPSGSNFTVLHSFSGADGAKPFAGLARDSSGDLYGTTAEGGSSGDGTVFKLDPSGTLTVLYSFSYNDGAYPEAGLVLDSSGNLYGTTDEGGSSGDGTAFKLDPSGDLAVLHSFTYNDGASPSAGLVRDSMGNLYGTTLDGGSSGDGTVFKLDPSGNLTVLHSFTYYDGANAFAGLILDSSGNLYGTTATGGSGFGTVFEIATTPQQGTQLIINEVDVLGVLNKGQQNSLVTELNQATSLMNKGKNAGAIQNLQYFIAETEDLESSGVLTSSQAEPLISNANAVIAELQ